MSAAEQYKEQIAAITATMADDVERNDARRDELQATVPGLYAHLLAAADRTALIRIGAELAWEDALEVLWHQTRVTMHPFPKPDRFVKETDVMALSAAVEERAAQLRALAHRKRT